MPNYPAEHLEKLVDAYLDGEIDTSEWEKLYAKHGEELMLLLRCEERIRQSLHTLPQSLNTPEFKIQNSIKISEIADNNKKQEISPFSFYKSIAVAALLVVSVIAYNIGQHLEHETMQMILNEPAPITQKTPNIAEDLQNPISIENDEIILEAATISPMQSRSEDHSKKTETVTSSRAESSALSTVRSQSNVSDNINKNEYSNKRTSRKKIDHDELFPPLITSRYERNRMYLGPLSDLQAGQRIQCSVLNKELKTIAILGAATALPEEIFLENLPADALYIRFQWKNRLYTLDVPPR